MFSISFIDSGNLLWNFIDTIIDQDILYNKVLLLITFSIRLYSGCLLSPWFTVFIFINLNIENTACHRLNLYYHLDSFDFHITLKKCIFFPIHISEQSANATNTSGLVELETMYLYILHNRRDTNTFLLGMFHKKNICSTVLF